MLAHAAAVSQSALQLPESRAQSAMRDAGMIYAAASHTPLHLGSAQVSGKLAEARPASGALGEI